MDELKTSRFNYLKPVWIKWIYVPVQGLVHRRANKQKSLWLNQMLYQWLMHCSTNIFDAVYYRNILDIHDGSSVGYITAFRWMAFSLPVLLLLFFFTNTGDNVWDQRQYSAGLVTTTVTLRSQLFKFDILRTRVRVIAETSYMTPFVTHACACVMQLHMAVT